MSVRAGEKANKANNMGKLEVKMVNYLLFYPHQDVKNAVVDKFVSIK